MNSLSAYIPQIVESLKKIDPYQIYLFGSLADKTANQNSDIDIVVILNKEEIPKDYEEKLNEKVKVRDTLLELSFKIPIDLLVYSKGEFKKLQKINKAFAKEITQKGFLLYERTN